MAVIDKSNLNYDSYKIDFRNSVRTANRTDKKNEDDCIRSCIDLVTKVNQCLEQGIIVKEVKKAVKSKLVPLLKAKVLKDWCFKLEDELTDDKKRLISQIKILADNAFKRKWYKTANQLYKQIPLYLNTHEELQRSIDAANKVGDAGFSALQVGQKTRQLKIDLELSQH